VGEVVSYEGEVVSYGRGTPVGRLVEREAETSPDARRRAEWLPPQDAATT